jgi:MFS family permease
VSTATAGIAAATAKPRVLNPWIVALAVIIPTFMEVLDTTIANVALRYIAGGLSAPSSDSEWVITSYLAANAIILPMSGWLSVRLGRRRYFLRKSAVLPSLKFHSIGQVGYALFAPAAWAKEKESATTLLTRRPVAISAGGEFINRFQDCCEKAKLVPNLRFSCASFTQVAELVRSGLAVALLPEMAEPGLRARNVKRLEFLPMRTYRREIGIVWHRRLVSIRLLAEFVLTGLKQIEA